MLSGALQLPPRTILRIGQPQGWSAPATLPSQEHNPLQPPPQQQRLFHQFMQPPPGQASPRSDPAFASTAPAFSTSPVPSLNLKGTQSLPGAPSTARLNHEPPVAEQLHSARQLNDSGQSETLKQQGTSLSFHSVGETPQTGGGTWPLQSRVRRFTMMKASQTESVGKRGGDSQWRKGVRRARRRGYAVVVQCHRTPSSAGPS